MTEIKRCSKCGAMPTFIEYEQSIDGNHDTAAKVECQCGNVHRTPSQWTSSKREPAMLTNDERRRVASVLLLLNAVSKRFSKKDSWDALRMAVGTYEDAPFAGCVTFARLAELIDPDVTRNVPVSQIAGMLDTDLGRMVGAMRDLYDM